LDANTGKARYGRRRLSKPARRPLRAPAISRLECGRRGCSPAALSGSGFWEESDMVAGRSR
jgi:hypothetical protein